MKRRFRKSLFGFKPADVESEIKQLDGEYQNTIASLQLEIEKKKEELKKTEEEVYQLRNKINEYTAREHTIAEVFLEAQKRATQIEEEARATARKLIEESENELRKRNQELMSLREKVALFKEEFKKVLDKYRFSLETVTPEHLSGGLTFYPKLVDDKNKERGSLP
jgi:chromosome segregation ATPase